MIMCMCASVTNRTNQRYWILILALAFVFIFVLPNSAYANPITFSISQNAIAPGKLFLRGHGAFIRQLHGSCSR